MKDIVYHELNGCNVHDGLRCINEVLDQLLVLLGAVSLREASLLGMGLVPGLNLRHSQCHRCTTTDAMEGDLLDMGRDVMEAGIDEETLSIDGHCSHICRQLEVLQLHHQGWRS